MPPKSGHQRAKNIDYDDDDIYSDEEDYYEEEGGEAAMTEEDREQMAAATLKVKEALDASFKITDTQIQEALWHYYYDVGKSVSYLKSRKLIKPRDMNTIANNLPDKYAPKAPSQPKQPQKPVNRFDQAASAAGAGAPTGKQSSSVSSATIRAALRLGLDMHDSTPLSPRFPICHNHDDSAMNTRDFFWDTPWGNVPPQRLGTMTPATIKPVGGLLGGSKLAALAAKRKQKQQEQAAKAEEENGTEKAVELLDRLSVKSDRPAPSAPSAKATKPTIRYQRKRSRSPSPKAQPEAESEEEIDPEPARRAAMIPKIRAQPSMFAATLCSKASPPSEEHQQSALMAEFALPYTKMPAYIKADPFGGPSPDDIVQEAQKRGAGRH